VNTEIEIEQLQSKGMLTGMFIPNRATIWEIHHPENEFHVGRLSDCANPISKVSSNNENLQTANL
jgi:hypothetical protein